MEHQLNKKELREKKTIRSEFKSLKRNDIYIILDNFKVHHNVGTMFRIADAILAKKIYLLGKTISPPNYKLHRSARGSENWVPFEKVTDEKSLIEKLKKDGVKIVSVEITDKSIPYTEFIPDGPVAIILGNEYEGISESLIEVSDACVHLPIYGMCNSINVSNAGSVVCYDILSKMKSK